MENIAIHTKAPLMTGSLRPFPQDLKPEDLPPGLKDLLPTSDSPERFNSWQRGVVKVVHLQEFRAALLDAVRILAEPDADADILVEALHNHFSLRNPGFGRNWWHFRASGLVLHIDEHGVRFEHPEDTELAHVTSVTLAETIPKILWSRTFLTAWPGGEASST